MKSFLCACFLLVLVLSSLSPLAQGKRDLPGGLKPDSSVTEILTWLGQAIIPNARIVLKDSRDDYIYRPPWDNTESIKHTFIFLEGFRVTNVDGCNLMLRHDDAREVTNLKSAPSNNLWSSTSGSNFTA